MKELKDLKLMDNSKLLDLSADELKVELVKSEKNLFILRMKKQTGELKQTHLMKPLRRYIAKIKTFAV